jgi:hypothetical protein
MSEESERTQWLADLKAGDHVAYQGDHSSNWHIAVVKKRTPTGRIVTENRTFDTKGHSTGSSGFGSHIIIYPVTQEIRDSISHRVLCHKLRHFNWYKLPLEKLREIIALVPNEKSNES